MAGGEPAVGGREANELGDSAAGNSGMLGATVLASGVAEDVGGNVVGGNRPPGAENWAGRAGSDRNSLRNWSSYCRLDSGPSRHCRARSISLSTRSASLRCGPDRNAVSMDVQRAAAPVMAA